MEDKLYRIGDKQYRIVEATPEDLRDMQLTPEEAVKPEPVRLLSATTIMGTTMITTSTTITTMTTQTRSSSCNDLPGACFTSART
jgi:hypothetical protein